MNTKNSNSAVPRCWPSVQIPRSAFQQYWEKENIPFIGLPDPEHRIAVRYRQQVNLFKLGRMPLLCIIDRSGHIRYAHFGASMADIPENQTLLDVMDTMQTTSN